MHLSSILRRLRETNRRNQSRRNKRQRSGEAAFAAAIERLEDRQLLTAIIADFNGDGFGDLAVGVPGEDIEFDGVERHDAGAVNVIYGTADGLNAEDNEIWHQRPDTVKNSAESGDRFGEVLAAGNFNGDSYMDLAIGIPGEDVDGVKEAGAVAILYGSPDGLVSEATAFVVPSGKTYFPHNDQYFHQDSIGVADLPERFDRFGSALAVGDFNGDQIDDLAIGIPGEGLGEEDKTTGKLINGLTDAGAVQILFGSVDGLNSGSNFGWFLTQSTGDKATGDEAAEEYDMYGYSLAAGNFDGVGYDDLAIGIPGEDIGDIVDSGAVEVRRFGINAEPLLLHQALTTASKAEDFDSFGMSLAAGDLNGDHADDLAVGVPLEDIGSIVDAGAVNVLYGTQLNAFGPETQPFSFGGGDKIWNQQSAGIEGTEESYDLFGTSLAIADFDGDGVGDLAIGAPGEDVDDNNSKDAGAVNLIYGKNGTGLTSSGNRLYSQHTSGIEGDPENGDAFGSSLAAGYLNSGKYADLAIGVPGEDYGAGAVNVLYHSSDTGSFKTSNDQLWDQSGSIEGTPQEGDHFGGKLPIGLKSRGLVVPGFQSNQGATNTLYLDFNGHTDQYKPPKINGFQPPGSINVNTPIFDADGDSNYFGLTELAIIQDAWDTMAEDFAPFDINVTTVHPGIGSNPMRIAFGGNWTDNLLTKYSDTFEDFSTKYSNGEIKIEFKGSGISPWMVGKIGVFTNPAVPNTAYVFTDYIFEKDGWKTGIGARFGTTGSHEAGHSFGLEHKSNFKANGDLAHQYTGGGDLWTPIMGKNRSTDRTIWTKASMPHPTSTNNLTIKGDNDVDQLADVLGLRADDHDSDIGSATPLGVLENPGDLLMDQGIIGVIEDEADIDTFVFEVKQDKYVGFELLVNDIGANLDSTLRIGSVDTGEILADLGLSDDIFDAVADAFGMSGEPLGVNLEWLPLKPGKYFVQVGSAGNFDGDLGQYTLRVVMHWATPVTSVEVVGGSGFADWISSFVGRNSYVDLTDEEMRQIASMNSAGIADADRSVVTIQSVRTDLTLATHESTDDRSTTDSQVRMDSSASLPAGKETAREIESIDSGLLERVFTERLILELV